MAKRRKGEISSTGTDNGCAFPKGSIEDMIKSHMRSWVVKLVMQSEWILQNFLFREKFCISNSDHEKLQRLFSLFNLKLLIKKEGCIRKLPKPTIGLIFTNKALLSFQNSRVHETELSDHRKLIAKFFKSHFTRLHSITIYFLIPMSNENNLICLFITQTPAGKIKHSFCGSWAALDFVF